MKKFLSIITCFYIIGSPAYSDDIIAPVAPKKKIIIYNFKHGTNEKKYDYYSFIIPLTLVKSLDNSGNFEIRHVQEILELSTDKALTKDDIKEKNDDKTDFSSSGIEDIEKKYDERMKLIYKKIDEILNQSKEKSLSYIITGSYTVAKNNLNIIIRIYNIKGKKIVELNKNSMEVGALLKDTTDDLTSSIENKLAALEQENKKAFAESPYLKFYKGITFISFGFDAGEMFPIHDFKKRYNNTQFINSYIMYYFALPLGISLNIDYFGADNDNKNTGNKKFTAWSGIIDISYFIRLSKYINFSLAGGGGAAKIKIEEMPLKNGAPYDDPISREKTTGQCIKLMFCMNLELSPVIFKFGTFYKKIFYSDIPLDMYSIFAGVGYRI